MKSSEQLKRGDWVEILSLNQILATLDMNGALDSLPFMPEMIPFCGRRFRIARRVEQICIDGAMAKVEGSFVREFHHNNVVMLEQLRCDGAAHGGCKRSCSMLWKEAWLSKVVGPEAPGCARSTPQNPPETVLRTTSAADLFYCQSSEMLKATATLSGLERLRKCFTNVAMGNYSLLEMLRTLGVWAYWRIRQKCFGVYPKGNQNPTPTETLDLQPGECVEVKALEEIVATLDVNGRNRGLHFSADMSRLAGKRFWVHLRAETLIGEGSGKVFRMKNSVILKDAICDSACYAFGGCPREDVLYWREIWLKRAGDSRRNPIPDAAARVHAPVS